MKKQTIEVDVPEGYVLIKNNSNQPFPYSFVKKEDLSILFDGERFEQSIEKNHRHENDKKLTNKVRKIHLQIGRKYGWQKINANLPIAEIHELIWEKIKKIIK